MDAELGLRGGNKLDRIVCLIGESGSGKSTIAEELEKKGYNYIQSYTTRPKRHENEKGHIFVDKLPEGVLVEKGLICRSTAPGENIIAYTHFNNHHYWATSEQYKGKGNSVYVIDPKGVKDLKMELWGDCFIGEIDIIAVYLKVDESKRVNRLGSRDGEEKAFERIMHDREKFRVVECDYIVDANRPVYQVMQNVIEIIEQ